MPWTISQLPHCHHCYFYLESLCPLGVPAFIPFHLPHSLVDGGGAHRGPLFFLEHQVSLSISPSFFLQKKHRALSMKAYFDLYRLSRRFRISLHSNTV